MVDSFQKVTQSLLGIVSTGLSKGGLQSDICLSRKHFWKSKVGRGNLVTSPSPVPPAALESPPPQLSIADFQGAWQGGDGL